MHERDIIGKSIPGKDNISVSQLSGIRKIISEKLVSSLNTTAQYTLFASFSTKKLMFLRNAFKDNYEDFSLNSITLNDIFTYTVSRIILLFPKFNSHLTGNQLNTFSNVNIGVAVDTDRGLMVPVLKNADKLSIKEISLQSKELINSCRSNTISMEKLQGGTFSISNLGSLGIDSFTPIINPPEIGILGIGKENIRPVVKNGEIVFEKYIKLSLTINHQVIDGAPGARFLGKVCEYMENIDNEKISI